jgi:uncharacterized protein
VKVLLDANVLISYLLAPDDARTVVQVVNTCLTEAVTLLVPPELISEIETTVQQLAHLNVRIELAKVAVLMDALTMIGIVPPPIAASAAERRRVTRDANDDYLVGQALLHEVDYLVTGDKDLLVLGKVQNLRILSPAQFWNIVAETL